MSDSLLVALIGLVAAIAVAVINRLPALRLKSQSAWTKLALFMSLVALLLAIRHTLSTDAGESVKQLVKVGDVQICWGTKKQEQLGSRPQDRLVLIQYRDDCRFLEAPQLTVSVHVTNSQGTTWATYSSEQDAKGAKLTLRGVNQGLGPDDSKFKEGEVRVDYVAIGRWK